MTFPPARIVIAYQAVPCQRHQPDGIGLYHAGQTQYPGHPHMQFVYAGEAFRLFFQSVKFSQDLSQLDLVVGWAGREFIFR